VQGVVIPATYAGDAASAAALATAARREGHVVLMSHDIGLLDRATVTAHPDWAARQNNQNPFGEADASFACVNTAYYRDEVPSAVRTLAARDVDAVLGIRWSGLGRGDICRCDACATQFRAFGGGALPAAANINDAQYRDWLTWSQARRVEIWKVNDDAATQARAGVRWIGMVPVARDAQSHALLDIPALAQLAPMLFVDSRAPTGKARFRMLYQDGRHVHGLAPHKTVVLVAGTTHFATRRFSAVSTGTAEERLRLATAIAAGMHPAVDIGPNPFADARGLEIGPPVMQWHKASESSLRDRVGVGEIGVVWSSVSAQLYGGAQSAPLSDAPYRGMTYALMRAHLPYRCLTTETLTSGLNGISTLLLPNVTILSDRVMDAIRQFVQDGGNLVATGHTSLYQTDGAIRTNFGLNDVFGVDVEGEAPGRLGPVTRISSGNLFGAPQTTGGIPFRGLATDHSYLELKPQYEGQPAAARTRHPIIRGWLDEADFLLFGGILTPLRVAEGRQVLMTYVKPFPQLPTDEAYVRERTDFPGLVVGQFGRGRVVFMPADIDRRYGIDPTPDHGCYLPASRAGHAATFRTQFKSPGMARSPRRSTVAMLLPVLPSKVGEGRGWRAAPHDQHGRSPVSPLATVERGRRLTSVGRNAGVRETDRRARLRVHELHPQERHEQP